MRPQDMRPRDMRLPAIDEGHLRNGLPGTIGIAAVVGGGPPLDLVELRSRVRERWGGLERMSLVLQPPVGPAGLSGHRWGSAGSFDPVAHVTATDQDLSALLTNGVSQSLPRERPLWRLMVTEQAVVLLAHHALLDGRSLETLFRLLMDDGPALSSPGHGSGPAAGQRPSVGAPAVLRELRRVSVPGRALPPAPAGAVRPSVAVVELDPQAMRAARGRPVGGRGATLNELLLSTYAGALRACYGPLPSWPTEATRPTGPAPLYVTVPVDLRGRHDAGQLGNVVTQLRIPLPVDVESPVERLRACQELVAAMARRCDAHRAILPVLEGVVGAMPWLADGMAKRLARPRVTTSLCTAFKWRDNPSRLHGRAVSRVVPVPQLSSPGSANLCLVQTGDAYTLTVVSHLGAGQAQVIGDAVARELKEVAASA